MLSCFNESEKIMRNPYQKNYFAKVRVAEPLSQVFNSELKFSKHRIPKKFGLVFAVTATLLGWNLVAEAIEVPGAAFLEYDGQTIPYNHVRVDSGEISLFRIQVSNKDSAIVNLKQVADQTDGNYSIEYSYRYGSYDFPYFANIDMGNHTLALGGASSILSFSTIEAARTRNRNLTVTAEEGSKLILKGTDFGMKLGGLLNFTFDGIDDILIEPQSNDKSAGGGISLTDNKNWPLDSAPNANLIITNNKNFKIEGDVVHAIASYGNNSIDISSDDIVLDIDILSGKGFSASTFNALVSGSGKISLTGSNSVVLGGKSSSPETDKLFKESYAIRGADEVCDACGNTTVIRKYNADFQIHSDSLSIDSNWGAVFMEAIESDDHTETFYAKTLLDAKEIKVVASGTSEDGLTNATFKAISDVDAEAGIVLNAKERITVDYRDVLDKENKQDLFYATGEKASIALTAPLLVINNNYEDSPSNNADLRNVFFADANSQISLKGKAQVVGNTTARGQGNVSLNLETGSTITGAMFDNSYLYYDATTCALETFKDKGQIDLTGSSNSVWNVLPYVDSEERGEIWGKATVRSTVNTIDGGTSTAESPFRVNLTGSVLPSFAQTSLSHQGLNVSHLKDGGFVQFELRFNEALDDKGINQRDVVLINEGSGNHGIYVKYEGSHDYDAPESLRDAWLVSDESQNTGFTLTNENARVDIGLYQYELASEVDKTSLGGDTNAKYWYLKRASSSSEQPPLTPGADTVLSFAGSQRYLHWADLQDLRKRLGEVRYGSQDGAWARIVFQKDRADGTSGESGIEQKYRGLNIGFDRFARVSEERMWLLGGSFSFGDAEQETRHNNHGKGETDRYGVNLYATWAHNKGSYVDFVLSGDYFKQKNTTRANNVVQKGNYNTWGFGVSAEIGHQFSSESRDLAWGPWYRHTWIEPQLQLSYYWLKGKDYRLSNKGIRVNQANEDSLIGRAGVVIGTKWNYGENYESIDKRYVQVWAKGGVKHDFLGNYRVSLNDRVFSNKIGKTTVYYGVGADWQISKRSRFYFQAERETGSNYSKDYEVSAGFKYSF